MDRPRAKTHDISDSEGSDDNKQDNSQDLFSDLFGDDSDDGLTVRTKVKERPKKQPGHLKSDVVRREKTDPANVKDSVVREDVYDADTDVDEEPEVEEGPAAKDRKPLCKYGSQCYRKNTSHLQEFHHPTSPTNNHKRKSGDHKDSDGRTATPMKKTKSQQESHTTKTKHIDACHPFNFFLTKVSGIPSRFNDVGAMNLKDILSPTMGQLEKSCQFNFMFDIPWMVQQYSPGDRIDGFCRHVTAVLFEYQNFRSDDSNCSTSTSTSLLCLCNCNRPANCSQDYQQAIESFDLDTSLTDERKMMFLLYKEGLRVVIHTANLIPNDWHQKTQGMWISQVFPRLQRSSSSCDPGDSRTKFKANLLQYVKAYKSSKLTGWEDILAQHDMSSANVHIVASVPGRHTLEDKHKWGHLKLKKILSSSTGSDQGLIKNWPVIGQFSSIGSLGPNPEAWLLSEWGQSVWACGKSLQPSSIPKSKLHLMFPSKDNIRLSLEGYNGGGCVPYSIKTASKQPWLTPFFCQWKSEGRGRSRAVPHIKSYTRCSPDGSQAAWFVITSANLSKAAWGALEKKGSQLMIRSYEIGVLFMPSDLGYKNSFKVSNDMGFLTDPDVTAFPLPYDLPVTDYVKGDRPWFVDVPCMDAPDTFGTMWCPPL